MSAQDPLILIGRVAGAHGVRGEVRITAYGEDPMALLGYRDLLRQDGSSALTVVSGRQAKASLIAVTRELTSKEAADEARGLELYVRRSRLPEPEEDEFYVVDLVGLQARGPDEAPLGRVKAVHDFGAGDILEIEPAERGPTWMIPFTREAVPELDIRAGWVTVVRPAEVGETED